MDNQDRQAIETLFSKLAEVERLTPPRDAEAEAFIGSRIAAQPAAPYYMAQTIIVQEQALEAAQRRIEALEDEVENGEGGGGLFADLFGGGSRNRSRQAQRTAPAVARPAAAEGRGPWGGGAGGGGFLAGAAQTALGVAGGVLLGNMIAGAFGGGEAHAAEAQHDDSSADDQDNGDIGGDSDFGDFDGGDFGDGGDF